MFEKLKKEDFYCHKTEILGPIDKIALDSEIAAVFCGDGRMIFLEPWSYPDGSSQISIVEDVALFDKRKLGVIDLDEYNRLAEKEYNLRSRSQELEERVAYKRLKRKYEGDE